ncbi:hypothetical protein ACOTTU_17015 [Roseobacter sp. EG26]|uniref:hypothetical protein n=1 Tax=Roseobacter sp. EG26 TaxID=3412477 RepID=UPI003CE47695
MSFDTSGLPVTGGVLLAAAVVVCTSVVTGQEMARRQIDLSGWDTQCPVELVANARADLQAKRKPREIVPEKRCSSEADKLIFLPREYRDLGVAICDQFGDPDINGAAREAEDAMRYRLDALEAQRIARIKAKSGSQCACAKSEYLQRSLIQNAVQAATVRVVALPMVANRKQELKTALHSTACAALAEDIQ